MNEAPVMNQPHVQAAPRYCATCVHSRAESGERFDGHDRAYCGHPSVNVEDGALVPCERERLVQPDGVVQLCGVDGALWEPRV